MGDEYDEWDDRSESEEALTSTIPEVEWHHFTAAEEARATARRDMVWTDGDEAQTQALLGIGQILMKINHHLEQHLAAAWDEGYETGYWDGDPPHPLPGPDERPQNPYGKA